MNNTEVIGHYGPLGFEETEIVDGPPALIFESSPGGSYALLTDEEGAIPQSLRVPVIFAFYTPDDVFQWSVGFKNSYLFAEAWSETAAPEQKIEAIRQRFEAAADLR